MEGVNGVLILIYRRTNVGRTLSSLGIVQPALGCVSQGFNPAEPGNIKYLGTRMGLKLFSIEPQIVRVNKTQYL